MTEIFIYGNGLARIFEYGGYGGIGQTEPPREPSAETMREYSHGVGIPLKGAEVLPFFFIKKRLQILPPDAMSGIVYKKGGNRFFPRMAECGIANIMRQAGGRNDVCQFIPVKFISLFILVPEAETNLLPDHMAQ